MFQNKNLAAVKNNSFFNEIDEKSLKFQLNVKDFSEIEEGEIIYQSGDTADYVYLIIEGEIKLKLSGGLGSPIVVRKGKNEYFGEREVQESVARKSSAVANKPSLLYVIRKSDFNSMIQKSKELKNKLFGTHKENGSENQTTKEIVLNEPGKKLSELPFFNKTREMTSFDKLDIAPKEEKKPEPKEEPKVFEESKVSKEPIAIEEPKVLEEPIAFEEPKTEVEPEENMIPDDLEITERIEEEKELIEADAETEFSDIVLDGELNPYINIFTPESESEADSNIEISEEEEKEEYRFEAPAKEEKLNWDFEKKEDLQEQFPEEDNQPEESVDFSIPLIISTIKQFFSAVKTEELFITIPAALCELLDTEIGNLYLKEGETNEFMTWEKSGAEYSEVRLNSPGNLFTESVTEKKIINLSFRKEEETEGVNGETDIENILIFPLINNKNEAIGIIEFLNCRKGWFSKRDETLLTELSPLIMLALDKQEYIQNQLHSDRLVSLNKMANFLIQDIKNPILTIKQYSEHIKKQEVNPDIKPVLDMIAEQADSVVDLVHTTLGYSEGRIISNPQTLLLSMALDSILSLLAEYVESRNVKLYKKIDGDGLIKLDKKEFYQACFQIAKNACDAMPQGGNFYVITKREGDKIRIEFKDSGIGIPDSIKDRIFEPFMSHGKKEKTGLGLAIAEKIVKEHGGKIWAESDLGEGAVFIIVLPTVD